MGVWLITQRRQCGYPAPGATLRLSARTLPLARALPGPAGSGESGKSTIFKQMRILHGKGFSKDEREKTVAVIQQNIQAQMQVLVDMAAELDFTVVDAKAVEEFEGVDEDDFEAIAALVGRLWPDPGIQLTYGRRALFQLDDSAA